MKFINRNSILINFPKLLIIFLPGLLITGPFLADLSISVTALFFLIYCFLEKNYRCFDNFLVKILFFFYLWILICSLFSKNILSSLSTSIFYIRFIVFSVALYFFLEKDNQLAKKFFFFNLIFFYHFNF